MTTPAGSVTRISAGTNPYSARYADGTTAPQNFSSVREAQVEIERSIGNRRVIWTRDDLRGSIEYYRGELP